MSSYSLYCQAGWDIIHSLHPSRSFIQASGTQGLGRLRSKFPSPRRIVYLQRWLEIHCLNSLSETTPKLRFLTRIWEIISVATLVIMIHVESIKLHSGLSILVEFEDFVTLQCIGDTEVLYVESLTFLVTLMFMHGKSTKQKKLSWLVFELTFRILIK